MREKTINDGEHEIKTVTSFSQKINTGISIRQNTIAMERCHQRESENRKNRNIYNAQCLLQQKDEYIPKTNIDIASFRGL